MLVCRIPECMGSYDFSKIAYFAKKRFIDGCNTIDLMKAAKSQREKEEIALVSMLQIDNNEIRDLELTCNHASQCKVMDCRERLIDLITKEIGSFPV